MSQLKRIQNVLAEAKSPESVIKSKAENFNKIVFKLQQITIENSKLVKKDIDKMTFPQFKKWGEKKGYKITKDTSLIGFHFTDEKTSDAYCLVPTFENKITMLNLLRKRGISSDNILEVMDDEVNDFMAFKINGKLTKVFIWKPHVNKRWDELHKGKNFDSVFNKILPYALKKIFKLHPTIIEDGKELQFMFYSKGAGFAYILVYASVKGEMKFVVMTVLPSKDSIDEYGAYPNTEKIVTESIIKNDRFGEVITQEVINSLNESLKPFLESLGDTCGYLDFMGIKFTYSDNKVDDVFLEMFDKVTITK